MTVLGSPGPLAVHALRVTLYAVLGVRPVSVREVASAEKLVPLGGEPVTPSDSIGK